MDQWLGHVSVGEGLGRLGPGTSPLDPMAYGRDWVDAALLNLEMTVVRRIRQLFARHRERCNTFLSDNFRTSLCPMHLAYHEMF